MTARRLAALTVVVLAAFAAFVLGTPGLADAPGGDSASSELQRQYPLHQSQRCCPELKPDKPERVAIVETGQPTGQPSADDGGLASPVVVFTLIAAGVLALLATVIAVLGRAPQTVEVEPVEDEPRTISWRTRKRRVVRPVFIHLARPFLRYSYPWGGYVLRLVGERRGPVLKPRHRGEATETVLRRHHSRLERSGPAGERERRPRKLSPFLIRLWRPVLRFSPMWDGYVLRVVGERIGPVFEPKPGRYRKPVPAGSRPESESGQLPRPRRVMSLRTIRLWRPVLRYSEDWDGYVVRVVGNHLGPVVEPRGRPALPEGAGERDGSHAQGA
jgi:hypothetical protein